MRALGANRGGRGRLFRMCSGEAQINSGSRHRRETIRCRAASDSVIVDSCSCEHSTLCMHPC